MSSVPHACLGLTQSISSSPCSFRDRRFINVFSSEGTPIPQFNPSTASAVVIGTVTIGGSSYSSDFLAHDCESESQSFGSRPFSERLSGEHVKVNSRESENGSASSLSSGRSFHLVARKSARFKHRYVKRHTISRGHDDDLSSSPRSVHSCKTMPMTLAREKSLQSRDRSDDSNISLGDWKAVSYMSSEVCQCGSSPTGTAAAAAQNKFFFELFTADNTSERASCHSLPIIPRQFSFCSSDAGLSSVLCKSSFVHVHLCGRSCFLTQHSTSAESFFKADSSLIQSQSIAISLQSPASAPNTDRTPSNVLVPWRNGGFSREVELSDGSSEMSGSTESYAPPTRNKRGLFSPSKRLFTAFRKKTTSKFSFRNKQYQHLRAVELHEDPSVSLPSSYSSETNLIAQQQQSQTINPPSVFLGTFAAAALPLRTGNEPTLGAIPASNCTDQADVVDLKAKDATHGGNSASAFSQFESSKDWSSSSRLSSDSSSVGTQWNNADLDCSFASFAEALASDNVVSVTADIEVKDKIELPDSESSESLEVSESSEVPEEEESHGSFIGTIHDLSRGSFALSSSKDDSAYYKSLLPHVVSNSSDEMSYTSDESAEEVGFEGEVKNTQIQQANLVPNDDGSVEPANRRETSDECAANVVAWAIKNEMRKLEGNIPL